MPKVSEDPDVHFDPSLQTEDIAFKPDEMIICGSCNRQNPPNRLKCLYCAAALAVKDRTAVKLSFRELEAWEKGWNVILTGADPGSDVRKAAGILSIDPSDLKRMIESGIGLPSTRVESVSEAETIRNLLSGVGITTLLVSDKELEGERPPVRLSGFAVTDGLAAIDFNTHEMHPLATDAIALIVTGRIEISTTDMLEKRRRGKAKLLNEVATIADESLIDIYSRNDPTGYRIQMSGFDFSCLGADKTMLASENMRRLIAFLKARFPKARVVEVYDQIRDVLTHTWPPQVQKDHKGLVFAGIGKREFGKSESTNNLEQFTKFSRSQWHLL